MQYNYRTYRKLSGGIRNVLIEFYSDRKLTGYTHNLYKSKSLKL